METQVIKTKSERNFGIDLLRMIAMEMIVVLHLMGYGIAVFEGVDNVSPSMYVHLLLNILCGCGVNLYAFISGYVASGKKVRFSNLIGLWMRVVFYAVIFVVIAFIFGLKEFDLNTVIKSFFPTIFNYWWYWTAYFALFIFSPLLNIGIDHLNRKSGISLFITLFLLFSVLPTAFMRTHIFNMDSGLSVIWLMVLYVMGGIAKKFDLFKNIKTWILVLIYLASIAVIFGTQLLFDWHHIELLGAEADGGYFHNYVSPFTVVSAVALVLIFSRMSIKNSIVKKAITLVTPSVFSVYLIHEHFLVRGFYQGKFSLIRDYNQFVGVLAILGIATAVFVGCILIDLPRELIFKKLNLKKKIGTLEDKLLTESKETK